MEDKEENVQEDGKRTRGSDEPWTRMGGRRSTMRKEEEEEAKERNMTMSENKRGKM